MKRRLAVPPQLGVWHSVAECPPDKSLRLLMHFHGDCVTSCRHRHGHMGEPQQDILAWRSDVGGHFAEPTYWMNIKLKREDSL